MEGGSRKAGRPRSTRRSPVAGGVAVTVRLSAEEHAEIAVAAEAAGVSVAEWVRSAGLRLARGA